MGPKSLLAAEGDPFPAKAVVCDNHYYHKHPLPPTTMGEEDEKEP